MKTLMKYLDQFSKKSIVVIGDLMLDKYIFGKVERISPEAPVPIVTVEKENYVPGGAANAASNVTSLGGRAFLLGIVGNDMAKDILLDEAKARQLEVSGVLTDSKRPTIQKIRVLGQSQQLVRIDYEDKHDIDADINSKILEKLKKLNNIDAIIVSDYAKGTITRKLMEELVAYSKRNNILLVVDPKPKHKSFYKGVSLLTPNRKEAEQMTGIDIETEEDISTAGKKLVEDLNCSVLITAGEKGMSLFEKGKDAVHIPTVAQEVYDVSGAGDTVIASFSLAISSGASMGDAAKLANHAAGIKVAKLGTATVLLSELKESIDNYE
jgi:D-beta-D-heptose 7-phosphate kinase/D-beta-D-heptose 1-phosphate adenosyltransferase